MQSESDISVFSSIGAAFSSSIWLNVSCFDFPSGDILKTYCVVPK